MNTKLRRFLGDCRYILLNMITNRIPSWHIRSYIYKLNGMKIGKGSRIGIYTVVCNPKGISIGDNTIVNEFCFLDGRGGLEIGDNSSISVYTRIISATHNMNSSDFRYEIGKVEIGNNVWIGANAVVLNSTKLDDLTVIGAGCVFKGKSNHGEVYVGNPARLLKMRKNVDEYVINYHPYMR